MKPSVGNAIIGLACVLCLPLFSACEKTKADQGEEILSQILELWESTMEDYYDIVDDNSDICNKCLRDVRALMDRNEGQMRALASQWEQFKANSSVQDQREAVNRVSPDLEKAYVRLQALENENYETFAEFQKNCAEQTPDVYDVMKQGAGLFPSIIGHEFM